MNNFKKLTIAFALCVIISGLFIMEAMAANERKSVIFIHHSVGERIIAEGGIREILQAHDIDFWDHGYNNSKSGLTNAKGNPAGNYNIPDNNTRPDGYGKLFSLDPKGDNAFAKIIGNHDIISFKSCFPVSKIQGDSLIKDRVQPRRKTLSNYKRHYTKIRSTIDQFPDKRFVVITQPPLHPNVTNAAQAKRARSFANWLTSDKFIGGRDNIMVFDLFNLLADPNTHVLRKEYQFDPQGENSHPNPIANMHIGPQFADFIVNSVEVGKSANRVNVTVQHENWPYDFIYANEPVIDIEGRIDGYENVVKLSWSDFNGRKGDLPVDSTWKIRGLNLNPGTTKILITAVDKDGVRSSTVTGIKYFSGKTHQGTIFEATDNHLKLDGLVYNQKNPIDGKPSLVIKGNGSRKRVVINDINLNVSDYNPVHTYLQVRLDQGKENSDVDFNLQGIGILKFKPDNVTGFEMVRIPLKNKKYVQNSLDKIIIKGNWSDKSKVYIQSIKLISSSDNVAKR